MTSFSNISIIDFKQVTVCRGAFLLCINYYPMSQIERRALFNLIQNSIRFSQLLNFIDVWLQINIQLLCNSYYFNKLIVLVLVMTLKCVNTMSKLGQRFWTKSFGKVLHNSHKLRKAVAIYRTIKRFKIYLSWTTRGLVKVPVLQK